MVGQMPSAPGGLNRSVVFYVRIQPEDVSRQMLRQPPPLLQHGARRRDHPNAAIPVMSCPITNVWMSWVPSYVKTDSRLHI
jgi:hypothetical protein